MNLAETIRPGFAGRAEMLVGEEHTAPRVGSGKVHVLATPVMINLIEAAALDALDRHLPARIVRRRGKVGFETPQDAWLRSSLGDAMERSLASSSPVGDWIEPRDALELVRRARASRNRELGQAAVRVFLVDRWLRGRTQARQAVA